MDACLLLLCYIFDFSVQSQEIGWEKRLRNDRYLKVNQWRPPMSVYWPLLSSLNLMYLHKP